MKKAPSVSRRGFVAVTLLSLFYCSARVTLPNFTTRCVSTHESFIGHMPNVSTTHFSQRYAVAELYLYRKQLQTKCQTKQCNYFNQLAYCYRHAHVDNAQWRCTMLPYCAPVETGLNAVRHITKRLSPSSK
ncbi:TPA: hypothetical protein I7712_03875 [Vibrio vulnificus]|nr:hypothetical protein [Vibrio vulnificus]HAS8345554.1 hypothetical protein [Vibrio vulnificus]HAS8507701.1 hypothetical protein [Vibrio vulnificus]